MRDLRVLSAMFPELHERFFEQVRGVSRLLVNVAFRGLSKVNWSRTRLRPVLTPKPVRPMSDRMADNDAMDVSFSIAISLRKIHARN
jgi:hypothetical protein